MLQIRRCLGGLQPLWGTGVTSWIEVILKPSTAEINNYSKYLREHILIINPKILIIMGSTAMEALIGNNIKISKDRGKWKEIIIKNKTFTSIVTFHPAYL